MIRVAFLNRCRGEFWSIEELFCSIAQALPCDVGHSFVSAPRSGASFFSILFNLFWASCVSDADVLHITGDIHYTALTAVRRPLVLTIHDLRFIEQETGLRRLLFWLLWLYIPCRCATRVTVISEFTKQRLLDILKIDPEKLSVIPDCVSPEFRADPKVGISSPAIVLQVGTTSNKNLFRVATACIGMDIELWILGKLCEDQKAALRERNILFREYFGLTRSEVFDLYRACDIVCFVSVYEGFGMPILEAQAVGRPVLTSCIAPMDEVSGGAALLVNPLDVDAIRNGLNRLIGDDGLRTRLVCEGYENVRKYTAREVADQYARLYHKILAK